MGMLSKWRERRAARQRVRHVQDVRAVVDRHLRGKSMSDLAREGGWDVLDWAGVPDSVWKAYSVGEMEKAMRTSSIIFACVKKIATVAADVLMEIGEWDGDSWEPDVNHPYLDLLRQPNHVEDWRGFVWSFVGHMLLTGESYVLKIKNRAGDEIEALRAVPTSWVTPRYDTKTGNLTHYEIGVPNAVKPAAVLPEDVFVMRYADMSNPATGVGPMDAAVRDLQIDDARAVQMIEILTRMHFASLVISQKQPASPEQKRDIRARVQDKIGPGHRGDLLFVAGEDAKAEFKQSPNDVDWPGTAGLSESRICAAFGVPPILVNLRVGLEHGTYSNYGLAKTAFYQDTMRPLWDQMAGALERGLFRSEGRDEEVEADYDDIPELRENVDAVHERARKDYHGGLLTKNRALEVIGEETIGEAGETYVLPMNLIETPAGQAALPPTPPNTAPPDEDVEDEPEEPVATPGDDDD